ncbi:hypothetical protein SAMN05660733_06782, partial [Lentzea albidocapillata]
PPDQIAGGLGAAPPGEARNRKLAARKATTRPVAARKGDHPPGRVVPRKATTHNSQRSAQRPNPPPSPPGLPRRNPDQINPRIQSIRRTGHRLNGNRPPPIRIGLRRINLNPRKRRISPHLDPTTLRNQRVMDQPVPRGLAPAERSVQPNPAQPPPTPEVVRRPLHRNGRPRRHHPLSVQRQNSGSGQRQSARIGRSIPSPRIRMRTNTERRSNVPDVLDPMRNSQPVFVQRIGHRDAQSSRPPRLRFDGRNQRHQRPGVLQHGPGTTSHKPVDSVSTRGLGDLELLHNPVQHPRRTGGPVGPRHEHGPGAHRGFLVGAECLHVRNAVHLERPQPRAYSRDHGGGTLVRDPQHEAEAYGASGRICP